MLIGRSCRGGLGRSLRVARGARSEKLERERRERRDRRGWRGAEGRLEGEMDLMRPLVVLRPFWRQNFDAGQEAECAGRGTMRATK